MKKSLFALLAVLLTVVMTCFVSGESPFAQRLTDKAGLLDSEEYDNVLSELDLNSDAAEIDIVVYTCYGLEGYGNVEQAATEIYEKLEFDTDGTMLFVDMEGREWYILTSGKCMYAIDDYDLDGISEDVVYYLSHSDYEKAFIEYSYEVYDLVLDYNLEDTYEYEDEGFDAGFSFVISLVVGLVAALIVTGIWKGQLKSVAFSGKASRYVVNNSLNITNSTELFLYRNVVRTERPKSSSGSSTTRHTSSSGRSYGGRGGKF